MYVKVMNRKTARAKPAKLRVEKELRKNRIEYGPQCERFKDILDLLKFAHEEAKARAGQFEKDRIGYHVAQWQLAFQMSGLLKQHIIFEL